MGFETSNTRAESSTDRAGEWASIVSEAYFPLDIRFKTADRFQGTIDRRSLGPVLLTHLRSEPVEYVRKPLHTRGRQTEAFLLTIPYASGVNFAQHGRDILCPPGGFLLENGDEPYRFAYGASNDLCAIKISFQDLSDRIRQPERHCAHNFDGTEGIGALLIETTRRAHQMRLDPAAAEVIGRHVIELLALALDRQAETTASAGSLVRAAHLRRAEAFVKSRITEAALSPQGVAEGCGISIRYLHSIFADSDRTVAQYIRDQRLLAARDVLGLPGQMKMAEIAYRFGFADQAIFSRQFRAKFGLSPTEFRAEMQLQRLTSTEGLTMA